jgi:hypothetical protein
MLSNPAPLSFFTAVLELVAKFAAAVELVEAPAECGLPGGPRLPDLEASFLCS